MHVKFTDYKECHIMFVVKINDFKDASISFENDAFRGEKAKPLMYRFTIDVNACI